MNRLKIQPREEVFPFVNTDVVHNLELEKADYNIAASNADAGHDLWAFCHDNRLKLSFWYNVAKDIALIQPSSVFMERVFSILRACLDERQETCYSDRIRASAFLKYNKGIFFFFLYQGRSSLYCCAVYPCDIAVWLKFPVLNLVFQYSKKNQNAPRARPSVIIVLEEKSERT